MKTKRETISQIFQDNDIPVKIFEQFKETKDPVIVIDLLGRTLWMNDIFQTVNLKSDDDLLDCLSLDYGFEVFEQGVEHLTKELPTNYSISTIEFVSLLRLNHLETLGFKE